MTPDLLIVGHIVRDLTPDGWRPGGGAYYAAVQASRLGLRVAVVTSCAQDVDPSSIVRDVDWHVVSSDMSTTFENQYVDGHRVQRVLSRARSLTIEDVPSEWRDAPIVLITPVINDVDASLPHAFDKQQLIGIGAQGWLRELDGDRVRVKHDAAAPWLAGGVVFASTEDVTDERDAQAWLPRVQVVVLTRGVNGCTVWDVSTRHDLPAYETDEKDPTGAGDVFAAAFLVRYSETRDALAAARFASAAASLSVRDVGAASIAGRAAIETLVQSREALRAR